MFLVERVGVVGCHVGSHLHGRGALALAGRYDLLGPLVELHRNYQQPRDETDERKRPQRHLPAHHRQSDGRR